MDENEDAPNSPVIADVPAGPDTEAGQSLREIGLRAGTDKISHHEYDAYYPLFLEKYRERHGGAMFEIGLDEGKSLAMWLEYFPNAFIYGADIGKSYEGPRHKTFLADQGKLADLKRIVSSEIKHPVFLIIDDGSHLPEHQVLSFNFLFAELLQPGGVYIIEDIEVSYWTKGGLYGYRTRYGYQHPVSMVEICKHVIDSINGEFLTEANNYAVDVNLSRFLGQVTRDQIATITFGRNCIIITKNATGKFMGVVHFRNCNNIAHGCELECQSFDWRLLLKYLQQRGLR